MGNFSVCSAGATSSGCASGFPYTEAGILAVADGLRHATFTDSRVYLYTGACIGSSSTSCIQIVEFRP